MPKPFHQLTVEQFAELIETFPFTRQIDSVHMHHTWKPNHADYRGLATIEAMWEYHTVTNGWSDIAQHISIAPDGTIWTGRNWNAPPASATGYNGNTAHGPFMFETIGNFDTGRDLLEGAQKSAVLAVIAAVQRRFSLEPRTLRFHNMMSIKSCPGTALDYETILKEVADIREPGGERTAKRPLARRNYPFNDGARLLHRIAADLQAGPAAGDGDAEPCSRGRHEADAFSRTTVVPPTARGSKLTPELLRRLQPHVINLNQGRFSDSGDFKTKAGDVDAIFEDHLTKWAKGKSKIPIVFYAHGGLTSEESGLATAAEQIEWWLENGAYPIHFVWETGLLETLGQLLRPSRARAFDPFAFSDFLLERLARRIGGVKIWSAMKTSAERASDANGGARYAAKKLKAFCDKHAERVALHAVGHSAGSIFHAHFIPAAHDEKVPTFESLHFLAPAIRVDTFEDRLLKHVGKGKQVQHLSVFTMAEPFEKDDNCMTVYQKSLLYLIYHALEPEPKTPILGLEESIRGNAKLKRLFGLDGQSSNAGDVVWAVSRETSGRSASTSRTHGGFNNDAPTMQSVAERILGKAVTDFPATGERARATDDDALTAEDPMLAEFLRSLREGEPAPAETRAAPFVQTGSRAARPGTGQRRALCVGIDRYPTAPLGGCVNDARLWRDTFRTLGFAEPIVLLDGAATRSAIMGQVTELVRSSKAGDVVAFQFAGHGTQLKDLDGDEAGGDTPGLDEALCPIDFAEGRFVIDDDLGALFNGIPDGVNVTVFADCCHSGTITRLAIGTPGLGAAGGDVRARFLHATPQMQEAHAAFRASLGETRAASSRGAYDRAREVLFCACRSREVALESNGHGHFTTHATRVLSGGIDGLTNTEFHARVLRAFGANPSQNPELHCAPPIRDGSLLTAAAAGEAAGRTEIDAPAAAASGNSREELARLLENAVRILRD